MSADHNPSNMKKRRVLIVYTGGTIGMEHRDNDPLKPLRTVSWKKLETYIPTLKQLSIEIETVSFEKPIDSAEMRPEHWVRIANIVQEKYDAFDGFVILHGTDTLTYTASALSFMFENLSKPVILTGSQLPLGESRSDARQNLITSIMIAASINNQGKEQPVVPEVCVFFRDELLRGNRTRKFSAKAYIGFKSPNYDVLGRAGEHIEIYEKNLREPSPQKFFVEPSIDKNVISFNIFPGTSVKVLRSIFGIPGLKGVVLNTYGAGNAPTDPAFLKIIKQAISEHQIVVVNVTQCLQGEVEMGLYEASARMMDQGVVSGLDMSPEAALAKMSVLLAKGYKPEKVGELMQINQRGEMSKSLYVADFRGGTTDEKGVYCSNPEEVTGAATLVREKIVHSILRIFSLEVPNPVSELPLPVRAFINLATANRTTPHTLPHFAGEEIVRPKETPLNLLLDVTETAKTVIEPGSPVSVSVVTDEGGVRWRKLTLSFYAAV